MHDSSNISRQDDLREPIGEGIPRAAEVVFAAVGMIFCLPILFTVALAIKITSKGPVLFRQLRVGRGGRLFTLYKLRTMALANAGIQVTAANDSRVTAVGKVLRKTKMDELPELWNIIKGDMALVGPRPEVPRYVDAKNPMWQLVLQSRPGITDPMTLKLRNEEELLARVKGDREEFYLRVLQPYKLEGYARYLRLRTPWSDLKVLAETALAVVIPSRSPAPAIEELSRDGIR